MYPTLFEIFGVQIGSYGVSKALAALAAVVLLSREFRRVGWDRDVATTLVMATTLVGFLGAKLYYLAEHASTLTVHDFGGSGFTWYGGFLAGAVAFVIVARHHRLPLGPPSSLTTLRPCLTEVCVLRIAAGPRGRRRRAARSCRGARLRLGRFRWRWPMAQRAPRRTAAHRGWPCRNCRTRLDVNCEGVVVGALPRHDGPRR